MNELHLLNELILLFPFFSQPLRIIEFVGQDVSGPIVVKGQLSFGFVHTKSDPISNKVGLSKELKSHIAVGAWITHKGNTVIHAKNTKIRFSVSSCVASCNNFTSSSFVSGTVRSWRCLESDRKRSDNEITIIASFTENSKAILGVFCVENGQHSQKAEDGKDSFLHVLLLLWVGDGCFRIDYNYEVKDACIYSRLFEPKSNLFF